MTNFFESGQKISVKFFANKILDVVVAKDLGRTVLICSGDEFARSRFEERLPVCAEYPKRFDLSIVPH